jgi:hypothetical protein
MCRLVCALRVRTLVKVDVSIGHQCISCVSSCVTVAAGAGYVALAETPEHVTCRLGVWGIQVNHCVSRCFGRCVCYV